MPRSEYGESGIHGFKELSYGIAIRRGGEGALYLPRLELDEPGLRSIVLLYVPSKEPLVKPSTISLDHPEGCKVEVRLYEDKGVRGEATLIGECKASLYLVARLLGGYSRLKLAELKSGEKTSFSAKPAPSSLL